ncbi:hypothetical protein C8J56DRAFT_1041979 [Mycena floridula]|nr:hypothetical protein C8J56DRAFT_1041979 [Mycena floridula]
MSNMAAELLSIVAKDLRKADLRSFSLVSKIFWNVAAPFRYGTIHLTDDEPSPCHQDAIVRIVKRADVHIHTLALSGRSLGSPFILEVLSLCRNIRGLALINCIGTTDFKPFDFPRLVSLCISSPNSTPDELLLTCCLAKYLNLSFVSLGCPEYHTYWPSVQPLMKVSQGGLTLCLWGNPVWKAGLFSVFLSLRPGDKLSALEIENSGGGLQSILDKHSESLRTLRVRISDGSSFTVTNCLFLRKIHVSLSNSEHSVSLLCEAVKNWKVGQSLTVRMSFAPSRVGSTCNDKDYRSWRQLDDFYSTNLLNFILTFDIVVATRVSSTDTVLVGRTTPIIYIVFSFNLISSFATIMVSLDAGSPDFLNNFQWIRQGDIDVPVIQRPHEEGYPTSMTPNWFTVTGVVDTHGQFLSMSGDARSPGELADGCGLYSFREAYSNLLAFQNKITVDICGGHVLRNGKIRFEQSVFCPKDSSFSDKILTWSVPSAMQETLRILQVTHQVNPLLVHLPDRGDAHPATLVDAMTDALVQVDFDLVHVHCKKERRDYFHAHVIRVRVLPHNWQDTVRDYRTRVIEPSVPPPSFEVGCSDVPDHSEEEDG